MRTEASTEAAVLGLVPGGDILTVTETLDGWLKVDAEEGEGYVAADYVETYTEYPHAESVQEEAERLAREEAARRAAQEAEARRKAAEQQAAAQKKAAAKQSTNHTTAGNTTSKASTLTELLNNLPVIGPSTSIAFA